MVEPTNLNPRRESSLLIASDSGVRAGTCVIFFQAFTFGLPSTNCQRKASKLPNSFWIARKALAFWIAAWTLSRFLTIPGFKRSAAIFFSSKRAIFIASKLAIVAAVRHRHTGYDALLMNGEARSHARERVRS